MIKQLQILDKDQCAAIKQRLYELKPSWRARGEALADLEDLSFYTLGEASYLDIANPSSPGSFYDDAAKTNEILKSNFSWLYDEVAQLIEREFGQKVIYHPGFALPGFHVYEADFFFTEPFAPYHYDLHHYLLDWQGLKYDKEQTLSFTLAIDLPQSGAGLYFWPQYKFVEPDVANVNYQEQRQKMFAVDLSKEAKELYMHKVGHILIHTGMLYHQMAAMPDMQNGEARISLQGHGVLGEDGLWHLFW